MVIYVRCRPYGTWFPRAGRSSSFSFSSSSSLRGLSPIAITRQRTIVSHCNFFSNILNRVSHGCAKKPFQENIFHTFSRYTRVSPPRDTFIQRHSLYVRLLSRVGVLLTLLHKKEREREVSVCAQLVLVE